MRLLPALVVCTFLQQCVLGMDQDELPKLSDVHLSQTVIKTVETTVETMPAPPIGSRRQWRETPSPKYPILKGIDSKHLKWVHWNGSLPQWAVKVFIPETGENYICAPLSHLSPLTDRCLGLRGYYNPSKGPYCFNRCMYGDENVNREPQFEVLVNEQNIELLEWKTYESDDKHDNGILSGAYGIILLGKNRYGIGYILTNRDMTFLLVLPNKDMEVDYWPKPFDVLVVNQTGQYTRKVYDMQYQVNRLAMLSQQPTVLSQTRTSNHNCHDIEEEVELQKDTERQSTWETAARDRMRFGMTASVSTSVEVSVPLVSTVVTKAGLSLTADDSNDKTLTKSNFTETLKGNVTEILKGKLTETVSNSLTVKIKVPPNHTCLVKMIGRSFKFDVPFTARLSKDYTDGRVHTGTVSGRYHGIQVGEIEAVTERCQPLPNPAPCGR